MALPKEIDASFLARSDVFVMDAATPGVSGSLDRWPIEVLRSSDHGIRYVLFNQGDDFRNRTDAVRPPGNLFPETGGTEISPICWISCNIAQASSNVFRPSLDHPQYRSSNTTMGRVNLGDPGSSGNAASYIHMHGFSFENGLVLASKGCRVEACEWDGVDVPPENCIRFIFGAKENVITNCYFRRYPPFSNEQSLVCILIGRDGVNEDNVIENNVILNYTDQIQTIDSADRTGLCPGLVIQNNIMGFTEDVRTSSSQMLEGLENVLDFKIGGTLEKPVKVLGNIMFGVRQNARAPGYAVVFHFAAEHFEFENNMIVDSVSGVALIPMFFDGQFVTPKIKMVGNTFFNIQRNGSILHGNQPGHVFVFSNIVDEFKRNVFKECEFIFERKPDPKANAQWPFDIVGSNVAYEPFDSGEVEWPERIVESTGEIRLPIRFTDQSILVWR